MKLVSIITILITIVFPLCLIYGLMNVDTGTNIQHQKTPKLNFEVVGKPVLWFESKNKTVVIVMLSPNKFDKEIFTEEKNEK